MQKNNIFNKLFNKFNISLIDQFFVGGGLMLWNFLALNFLSITDFGFLSNYIAINSLAQGMVICLIVEPMMIFSKNNHVTLFKKHFKRLFLLGNISATILILISLFLEHDLSLKLIHLLILILTPISLLFFVLRGYIYSTKSYKLGLMLSSSFTLFVLTGMFTYYFFELNNYEYIYLVLLLSYSLSSLTFIIFFKKTINYDFSQKEHNISAELSYSIKSVGLNFTAFSTSNLPFIILTFFDKSYFVGLVKGLLIIAQPFNQLIQALNLVILPKFSFETNLKISLNFIKRIFVFMLLISIPAFFFFDFIFYYFKPEILEYKYIWIFVYILCFARVITNIFSQWYKTKGKIGKLLNTYILYSIVCLPLYVYVGFYESIIIFMFLFSFSNLFIGFYLYKNHEA